MIKVKKSCRIRWALHLAHLAEKKNPYRAMVENLEGKTWLQRPRCNCVCLYMNTESHLTRDRIGWRGLDLCGSGQGQVVDTFKHGNKLSDFINCVKFHVQMRNHQLHKKEPW